MDLVALELFFIGLLVSRASRSGWSAAWWSGISSGDSAHGGAVIELPIDLPAELVPLSWLIGVWEGSGVIDYKVGDDRSRTSSASA